MSVEKIGRYEVRGELGKGAMGIVYKAEDPTIGRTVAVKTTRLDVGHMDDEEVIRRFRHEARAAGALHHSNIVTIFDAGEQGDLFYIAMEYVEGETLQRLLRQRRFSRQETLDLARQICAGLDYAHSHGVIHRDVKPANIVVTAEGAAKIMDFGIAKTGGGMTTDGQVLGTPYYMSPEQVRGRPLDGRSDLFCLAVILYEMLTGEKPFVGENPNTIIYNIVNEEPKPPQEVDPSIGAELSGVLLRALQKNPNHRYATGAELVRELALCIDAGGVPSADAMRAPAGRFPPARDDLQKLLARAAAPRSATPAAAAPPAEVSDPRPTVHLEPRAARQKQARAQAKAGSGAWKPVLVLVALAAVALGSYVVYQNRSNEAGVTEPPASTAEPATKGSAEPVPTSSELEGAAAGSGTPAAGASSEPAATESSSSTTPGAAPGSAPASGTRPPPAPRMATMSVESNPQGAEIYLDGAKTGKTTPARLAVAPGKHTLMLTKEGFQEATTTAELRPGVPFTYATTLKEKKGVGGFFRRVLGGVPEGKGVIEVRTNPKGATILVNGNEQPRKSNTDLELDPGTYTVQLRLEGHKLAQQRVQVELGKKVKLEEKLVKQ